MIKTKFARPLSVFRKLARASGLCNSLFYRLNKRGAIFCTSAPFWRFFNIGCMKTAAIFGVNLINHMQNKARPLPKIDVFPHKFFLKQPVRFFNKFNTLSAGAGLFSGFISLMDGKTWHIFPHQLNKSEVKTARPLPFPHLQNKLRSVFNLTRKTTAVFGVNLINQTKNKARPLSKFRKSACASVARQFIKNTSAPFLFVFSSRQRFKHKFHHQTIHKRFSPPAHHPNHYLTAITS